MEGCLAFFCLASVTQHGANRMTGDLIFTNANVLTMDPARPVARSVVVRGDKILAVMDSGPFASRRSSGCRIIDCGGKTLMPGFCDAHCHVHAYAESLVSLNLSPRANVFSIADIRQKIRDGCSGKPPGTWVRGKAYSEFHLAERRHPNRQDLDAASLLHPVKLTHRSGHAHVLNSLALKQAGITADTGDPPGGMIDRDLESGEPTGILYGMGTYLAERIPLLDDEEMKHGAALASDRLIECGITSVQDASAANNFERRRQFTAWKAGGVFKPHLTMTMGWADFARPHPGLRAPDDGAAEVRVAGVKIIAGQVTGNLHPAQAELNEMIASIHDAGFQAVIHAVEEPVIEAACEAIEYALKKNPLADHRHRIEHCSVCPPPLVQRLVRPAIRVVTQPAFIYYSGDRYLETVPQRDLPNLYPIGAMAREGLRIGFSSDFPISEPNPMVGIHAAVSRMTEGGGRIHPEQGIGVAEALRMYTLDAAAAGFDEATRGSLSPGKFADLILLDQNPLKAAADRLKDIRVEMTVLGGRIVWPN